MYVYMYRYIITYLCTYIYIYIYVYTFGIDPSLLYVVVNTYSVAGLFNLSISPPTSLPWKMQTRMISQKGFPYKFVYIYNDIHKYVFVVYTHSHMPTPISSPINLLYMIQNVRLYISCDLTEWDLIYTYINEYRQTRMTC